MESIFYERPWTWQDRIQGFMSSIGIHIEKNDWTRALIIKKGKHLGYLKTMKGIVVRMLGKPAYSKPKTYRTISFMCYISWVID